MLGIIKRLFGGEQPVNGSKDVAKERLRLVLIHDRTNVSPQYLGLLKNDMLQVVSNYMDINATEMQVNLTREDQTMTLVANIPVNAVKRTPAARSGSGQAEQVPAAPEQVSSPVAKQPEPATAVKDN